MTMLEDGLLTIPMFELEYATEAVCDSDALQKLLERIEFNILGMIYQLESKIGVELFLNNVTIPVEYVRVGRYSMGKLHVIVRLGILMFMEK